LSGLISDTLLQAPDIPVSIDGTYAAPYQVRTLLLACAGRGTKIINISEKLLGNVYTEAGIAKGLK
jgi:hypothetical protein